MMEPKVSMTALILAGGKSLGKEAVLEDLAGMTAALFDETFIIASLNRNYKHLNLHGAAVLTDFLENKGPLVGLYTGLSYSTHQVSCVLTCDLPLVSPTILQRLVDSWQEEYDGICLEDIEGRVQPFPGIYRRSSRHFIRLLLDRGENTMSRLLDVLVIRSLPIDRPVPSL